MVETRARTSAGATAPPAGARAPYVVVSADTHAGAPAPILRDYFEAAYHPAFDEAVARQEAERAAFQEVLQRWAEAGGVEASDDPVAALDEFTCSLERSEGYWEPERWVRALEADGVAGWVIYAGARPSEPVPLRDSEVVDEQIAAMRAYNRWLGDFCSAMPGRAAGIALVPLFDDVDGVVDMIRAAHTDGVRGGIELPAMRDGVPGYHDPRYEPIWDVCQELDLPLNTHGGGGVRDRTIYGEEPATAQVLAFYDGGYFGRRHLPFFVYGGVLERFPGLKLVFTEQLSSWVPVELTKLDGHFREMFYTAGVRSRLSMTPLEYWHRNCYVGATFMSRAEAGLRRDIGVHNIMWGSDYPHPEGTNPYTTESLRYTFAGVPEAELRPMLGETAIAVYGLDAEVLRQAADRVGPSVEAIAEPLSSPPDGYRGFAFRSF